MTFEVVMHSLSDLPNVARKIIEFSRGNKVFAFNGELGTGKTTIIKEICAQLGSRDSFSSPTYAIINEYQIIDTAEKIYHLDLYRLQSLAEAIEAGVTDCLDGKHYCFIEWPQVIEKFLPQNTVNIQIQENEGKREISIFNN